MSIDLSQRATLPELKEFADKVRAAGGGNPLDALMPSVPANTSQCLIARNLNFNCKVYPASGEDYWIMKVDDEATCNKIADALGLKKHGPYSVILPNEIGAVARTFDFVGDYMEMAIDFSLYERDVKDNGVQDANLRWNIDHEDINTPITWEDWQEWYIVNMFSEELREITPEIVQEFRPYIEASRYEAYANATEINDDGSIVI